MDSIMRDITGIVMAIIGVAILFTLVSRNNNTAGVINASAGGLSRVLATAMGASTSGSGVFPQ